MQNAYNLLNRAVDNGLDETMLRSQVSLLAYSPLAFGLLTGKYARPGWPIPRAGAAVDLRQHAEAALGRAEALAAAAATRWRATRPDARAAGAGLLLPQLARASTIIGVTRVEQLDEDIDAWNTPLSPELLAAIDRIRWESRDPAQ